MTKKTTVPQIADATILKSEFDDPAADNLDGFCFDESETSIVAPPEEVAGKKLLPDQGRPDEPRIESPKWTQYVLEQLTDDEMFACRPTVAGLRRISYLLGDIVENSATVVQAPTLANGFIATVEVRLVIMWTKDLADNQPPTARVFTSTADVYPGNTDAAYARFASSMAETRAEGRALRKALQLQVVTAEELTTVPVEESGMDGKIAPAQRNFIDLKCMQCGINVVKFLNHGKNQYKSIADVPYATAQVMISHLSELQRNKSKIPEGILGYDPKWNDRS